MAKSSSTNRLMTAAEAPPKPSRAEVREQREREARYDMETLRQADAIAADKARLARAQAAARKEAEGLQRIAKATKRR